MPKHPACLLFLTEVFLLVAAAGVSDAAGGIPGIAQEQQRDDNPQVFTANDVANAVEAGTIVAEQDQQNDNPPPVVRVVIAAARVEQAHTKSLLVF